MRSLLCILGFLSLPLSGWSQSMPINFEAGVNSISFVDFDGGTSAIVSNPFMDASNPSAFVGQIIRDGGEIYAGSKIVLSNNVDFTTLTKISMDVYTTAPVGIVIKFKLEGTGPTADVNAVTTQSGGWETLEWVFAGSSNDLNELVLMFDFGNIGDGSTDSTFYFDNIQQVTGPPAPVTVTLPIDFENSSVLTSDFLSFGGGASASVIANPQMDAVNSSATVGQVIKNGGTFWSGTYLRLTNDLDLNTNWQLEMDIFTTAPAGTRLKIELENDGSKTDVDYVTTSSGSWETATFNFHRTASDNDTLIFFFDFGNVGDGSIDATFLFDNVRLSPGSVIAEPTAQSIPIDFETSINSTDLDDYFGAFSDIITNPFPDADNPSASVGRIVRSGGAPWAQSRIKLDAIIDFSTLAAFSMKVYTDAPVGTLLKFKVHSENDTFANEKDVFTTVSGEWATYMWDFAGDPAVYDRITLMLGYDVINNASSGATFYFDDIEQVAGSLSNSSHTLSQVALFPNPARELLHVNSPNQRIDSFKIYDLKGAVLYETASQSHLLKVDISNFSAGFYIADIITQEGGRKTMKFMVN